LILNFFIDFLLLIGSHFRRIFRSFDGLGLLEELSKFFRFVVFNSFSFSADSSFMVNIHSSISISPSLVGTLLDLEEEPDDALSSEEL